MGNILSTIVQITTNRKVVVFLVTALAFIYFIKKQSKSKSVSANKKSNNKNIHNSKDVNKQQIYIKQTDIKQIDGSHGTEPDKQIETHIDDEQQINEEKIDEKAKKIKALQRFEKKQKQRMKEKERTKQRRIQKEQEKKKKKKAILWKKKMAKRQKERLEKREQLRQKPQTKDKYSAEKENNERLNLLEKRFTGTENKIKTNQNENRMANTANQTMDIENECIETEKNLIEIENKYVLDNINMTSPSFQVKPTNYCLPRPRSLNPNSLDNYNKLRQRFASRYEKKEQHKNNPNKQIQPILIQKKGRPILSKPVPGVPVTQTSDEYKGNEEIIKLRALYKRQYKKKQKTEKLTLLNQKNKQKKTTEQKTEIHDDDDEIQPPKPKPTNIAAYLDDETKFILNEFKECICANTRFQGLADFGSHGKLTIELEITSDADHNGYLTGKRVLDFRKGKNIDGKARIYFDVLYNDVENKYVPCCKFEWVDHDKENGIITKCEFDSAKNEIDLHHSFFNGTCTRYVCDNDGQQVKQCEGYFDFLCVSARRREIKHNSFFDLYHTLDVNEMSEDELQKVPKYLRRMKDYTDKINDQLYGDNTIGEYICE